MTTVEAPQSLIAEFLDLAGDTCGEACWHAREDVCRCSCRGRNHGCLRNGGTQPERVSRKGRYVYRLLTVVSCDEWGGYNRSVEIVEEFIRKAWPNGNPNHPLIANYGTGEQARKADGSLWFYSPRADDPGIPAFARTASASQRRWPEATGYQSPPILVWARWDLISES